MTKQEVINELLGLINVIKMNKDLFKNNYDEDLVIAIMYTIKKLKHNKAGVIDEDN